MHIGDTFGVLTGSGDTPMQACGCKNMFANHLHRYQAQEQGNHCVSTFQVSAQNNFELEKIVVGPTAAEMDSCEAITACAPHSKE